MIAVISAGDPSRAQDNPRPGAPLKALVSSGIYFHFLWPSATRVLTFCLLQKKNPAPTLGLKPPMCEALWSHC